MVNPYDYYPDAEQERIQQNWQPAGQANTQLAKDNLAAKQFDWDGALKAGGTTSGVLDYLRDGGRVAYDIDGARKAGLPDEGIADYLRGKKEPEKKSDQSVLRRVADLGIDFFGKGAVGLGESAVGLANLAQGILPGQLSNAMTGNTYGKQLANVGYDPKETKKLFESGYSDARQKSEKEYDAASGVVDTATALATNPGMLIGKIAESAPSLLGVMGAAGRAYTAAKAAGAGDLAALATAKLVAAGGEGALTAGQIAESARQDNPNEIAKMYYALPAGAATALISLAVGKLPGGSMETILAGKGGSAVAGNALIRAGKGFFTEGLVEELPQSMSEQAFTNLATNKPVGEGVVKAGVSGGIIGGAMGATMGVVSHRADATQAITAAPTVDDAIKVATDSLDFPIIDGDTKSTAYDPNTPLTPSQELMERYARQVGLDVTAPANTATSFEQLSSEVKANTDDPFAFPQDIVPPAKEKTLAELNRELKSRLADPDAASLDAIANDVNSGKDFTKPISNEPRDFEALSREVTARNNLADLAPVPTPSPEVSLKDIAQDVKRRVSDTEANSLDAIIKDVDSGKEFTRPISNEPRNFEGLSRELFAGNYIPDLAPIPPPSPEVSLKDIAQDVKRRAADTEANSLDVIANEVASGKDFSREIPVNTKQAEIEKAKTPISDSSWTKEQERELTNKQQKAQTLTSAITDDASLKLADRANEDAENLRLIKVAALAAQSTASSSRLSKESELTKAKTARFTTVNEALASQKKSNEIAKAKNIINKIDKKTTVGRSAEEISNSDSIELGTYGVTPNNSDNRTLTLRKEGNSFALYRGDSERAFDVEKGDPITYNSVKEAVDDLRNESSNKTHRFLSTKQKIFFNGDFNGPEAKFSSADFDNPTSQVQTNTNEQSNSTAQTRLDALAKDVERQFGRTAKFTVYDPAVQSRGAGGNNANADAGSSAKDYAAARRLAKFFNKDIVFFKDNSPAALGVQGAVMDGNTIFVNVAIQFPATMIVAHELVHFMAKESPKVYADLKAKIQPLIQNEAEFRKRYKLYENLSKNSVTEEVIGNFLGDQIKSETFWGKLSKTEPMLFEKLANTIFDWIDSVEARIKGFDSETFIREIEPARDALVTAFAEYAKTHVVNESSGIAKFAAKQVERLNDATQSKERPALPAETKTEGFVRKAQDKYNRFQTIQDYAKANGIELSESQNLVLASALADSRKAVRVEDFREDQFKPIVKELEGAGFSLDQAQTYIHARVAIERNPAIAKINPRYPDAGSGMKTADAKEIVAKTPEKLKVIANKIQKLTDETLTLLVDHGVISQEQADINRNKYKFYAPLKGGDDVFTFKNKRAMGHEFRDEKIIENIMRDREMAIHLTENQRVAATLFQLGVELNNPDIISIGKPIKRAVLKPGESTYEVRYDGTAVDTLYTEKDAKASMRAMIATKQGEESRFAIHKVISDGTVQYKASPMLADNEVPYYLGGQLIRIQINDPMAAQAYKNMGVDHLVGVLKVGREANTWLSKMYTAYNPEFAFVNIVRDFTEGVINLVGDYGAGMAARVVSNYPKSFFHLLQYAATGKTTQDIRDFRADGAVIGAAHLGDLDRVGRDVKRIYNDYAGVMSTAKNDGTLAAARVASDKTVSTLAHFIEVFNRAAENAMRLSTYTTLRENGHSRQVSALAGKDVTLNFNRKGELANQMGAMYLFFNPAVQGTARTVQTLFYSKHKYQAQALTAGIVMLGYALAKMNADLDEDKWDKTPGYAKGHNMIIPLPGGKQFTIPIPYGYGFFLAMGTAMSDMERGKEKDKTAMMLANAFAESFSPVGNPIGDKLEMKTGVQLLPTLARIPGEIATNRSGLGGPIYPTEDERRDGRPDSSALFRNTQGSVWDMAAKAANRATGGNVAQKGWVDVHPDTLKSLWSTVTGGTGKFITDSAQAGNVLAQGGDLDVAEIPVLRKFVREEKTGDARKRFWDDAAEVRKATDELSTAKKNLEQVSRGKSDEAKKEAVKLVVDVAKENAMLIALGKAMGQFTKAATSQRDSISAIMADESLTLSEKRLKVKEMEREEVKLYDQFDKLFKDQKLRQKFEEERRARESSK